MPDSSTPRRENRLIIWRYCESLPSSTWILARHGGRIRWPRPHRKLRVRSTSQIVIPARLASTRLPRKLLLRETGKSLIQHTYEAAQRATRPAGICVATDHAEIFDEVRAFGGQVEMTRPRRPQRHRSGGRGRPTNDRRRHHRQRAGRRAGNRRQLDRPGHRAVGREPDGRDEHAGHADPPPPAIEGPGVREGGVRRIRAGRCTSAAA